MKILITLCWTVVLYSITYGQDWSEVMKVVSSDLTAEDAYGHSVSVDGNYAIVGAYLEDEDASGGSNMAESGSAYILERDSDGNWNEVQKIVSSDRTAGDKFGFSVSISGNFAIIGASGEDNDLNGGGLAFDAGSAYIFMREENGTWNEVHKIVASDRAATDLFGYTVSISGEYAVIGAYSEDENATGGDRKSLAGSAYIFKKGGDGNWTEVQKIVASDREPGDRFGFAVSIDTDHLIVGAYFEDHDVGGENTIDEAGSAYIFELSSESIWEEVQKIAAPVRFEDDNFGRAVSISGNSAIAGAHMEDQDASEGSNKVDAGAAYLYERDVNGAWNYVQKIVASDRASGDNFGYSVSVGNATALVGAWLEGSGTGTCYFYERNTGGDWNEVQKFRGSDAVFGDRFGVSVSISSGYAISGAHLKASGGAAYVFESSGVSATNDDFFTTSMNVYPNPTTGNVTIELHEVHVGVKLTVTDINGQVVASSEYGTTDKLSFDLSVPAGMYIAEVRTKEGRTAIVKIVKD